MHNLLIDKFLILILISVISKKNIILLNAQFIEVFYSLILKYIEAKTTFDKIIEKFYLNVENLPEENLKQEMEYVKSNAFINETTIKYEDLYKKRNGQYLKYKTIPKWHHYAWDMIK